MSGDHDDFVALKVEVEHLIEAVGRLDTKVDALTARANKWTGGLLTILALGGAGGVLTFLAGKLLK